MSNTAPIGRLAASTAGIGWAFAAKEGFRLFKKINPNRPGGGTGIFSPDPQQRSYSTSHGYGCKLGFVSRIVVKALLVSVFVFC